MGSVGSWDELCIVCGVTPEGGPHEIWSGSPLRLEAFIDNILVDISNGDENLRDIAEEALQACKVDEDRQTDDYVPTWLPEGMGSCHGQLDNRADMCIGIGHFYHSPQGEIPDGAGIRPRQIRGADGGSFAVMVATRGMHLEEVDDYREDLCYSVRAYWNDEVGQENFWTCDHCYHYLSNWLDRDELPPPGDASSSGRPPLTFAGEFYEIVNSRVKRRDRRTALLPYIDYDNIEDSLDQWQDHFIDMCRRRGSKHIARAITEGLRGPDLIPALLRDCRAWMFMRSRMWPEPSSSPSHPGYPFRTTYNGPLTCKAPLYNLPNELLIWILRRLPPYSILSVSATCRAFRVTITNAGFLKAILRDALLGGSLRWLLPVARVRDEKRQAFNAIRLWLPESVRPSEIPNSYAPTDATNNTGEENTPVRNAREEEEAIKTIEALRVEPLLAHPEFPLLAFIRACWDSDSMMNRKRIWGIVKQYEGLWRDYRTNGWEVNPFFPSERILDQVEQIPPECVAHDEYII